MCFKDSQGIEVFCQIKWNIFSNQLFAIFNH